MRSIKSFIAGVSFLLGMSASAQPLFNEHIGAPENDSTEMAYKASINNAIGQFGFKNVFKSGENNNASFSFNAGMGPEQEGYMRNYIRRNEKGLLRLKQEEKMSFLLIDGLLASQGIPKEMKYLAVIESNLEAATVSSAGAVGPWQFMAATGKNYGLFISGRIDERKDLRKSTIAAAKFLKELYNEFGDWLLVVAAYNCGPGRVENAIKKSGTNDFWKLQYHLPEESRNHVKKFIATHFVMEAAATEEHILINSSDLAHRQVLKTELENMDSLEISGKYFSSIIASSLNIDKKEFTRLNPSFDDLMSSDGKYLMLLPREKMKIFKDERYAILDRCVTMILQGDPSTL